MPPSDPNPRTRGDGLSPAELAAWRGLLRTHAMVIKELNAELEAEHGLGLSAYEVLLLLSNSEEGSLRMTDIAEAVLLTPSGVTRLVDRLCGEGLIERQPDARDQRVLRAALTEQGHTRFAAARSTHLTGVRRRFLGRLQAEDLELLAAAWERLLDDEGLDGPIQEPC